TPARDARAIDRKSPVDSIGSPERGKMGRGISRIARTCRWIAYTKVLFLSRLYRKHRGTFEAARFALTDQTLAITTAPDAMAKISCTLGVKLYRRTATGH